MTYIQTYIQTYQNLYFQIRIHYLVEIVDEAMNITKSVFSDKNDNRQSVTKKCVSNSKDTKEINEISK